MRFIRFLVDECGLREARLESERYEARVRYLWGDVSPYVVALSLRAGGYISHGSAVFIHGLTDQVPKTIYVNLEQSPKPKPRLGLSQERIDLAFSHRQRLSNLSYRFDAYTIVLLSGKHTGKLGVVDAKLDKRTRVPVTGLERTLVDIVVRPAYAGGLIQVLEAYRGAREHVSVPRLKRTIKALEYIYPYHQAIGYLLERAEYPSDSLRTLRAIGAQFDFYLGYGLREKEYDPGWRIFYPKGF